jgi:TPR repeat protein
MAGRLAGNLGASRLAMWLHLQAWRDDREHPHACYYYARTMLHRRGPLEAWKVLCRYGELSDAPPKLRAEWMAFYGYVTGLLRDFDVAERWLERAEELDPGNPWICIERSGVLEQEDRYPDALRAAQASRRAVTRTLRRIVASSRQT